MDPRDLARFIEQDGQRLDDGATAFITRQLMYVKSKTYDILYPGFKARTFIPVSNEADPGAESITYEQWDSFGMAKVVANYADDMPLVDVVAREFTHRVKSLGDAYQYTLQDLRRAAMAKRPLSTKKAAAARRGMEAAVDQIAAFGLADANMKGFLNHPNVPVVAPTTGNWGSATAAQILADLNKLVSSIVTLTKEVHAPDTLILPTSKLELISAKPMSDTNPNETVLSFFLRTNPHIRNIDSWHKLETADAELDGPRIVAYLRSSEVLELEIPQEFEQLPPQFRNLATIINCHSRIGGTCIYYPLAIAFMDGT